jgi:4-amino-4-deoxy-L-arabinose transferase-like glycosyltransferase
MTRSSFHLRTCLLILLLALGLRVYGIATESIWVDEAFSASASLGSVAEILELNARDTHPPAYYLGLSLWRQMLPSQGADPTALAIVLRGYSVVFSLVGIFLLMELARAMAGNATARFAGVFAACNPLDIYFADEARMYSQATAISLAGALALWHWSESVRRGGSLSDWWKAATAFALCGSALLLTHYVGATLLVGQGLLALVVFGRSRAWASLAGLAFAAFAVSLLFLPWLQYVLSFRESILHEVGLDWMPFPGFADYFSFVGREFFWGRAHKVHEQWWIPTALLPMCIFAAATYRRFRERSREGTAAAIHLLGHVAFPLLVCAILCASYQVVYYRPRYSIFLLPYFLIGLAMACQALGSRRSVNLAAAAVTTLMALGAVVQEQTPQKRAWRETADGWPQLEAPAFYVVLPAQHQRPLAHYLGSRIRHTPRHILERLVPLPEGAVVWVATWPEPLAPSDAAYRDWLKSVGPARHQTLSSYYTLTQVEPPGGEVWPGFAERRFRAWYRPFDVRGEVAGFSDARHFGALAFDAAGQPVRKSGHTAWLRFDRIRGGEALVLRATPPDAGPIPRLRALRAEDPSELFSAGLSAIFDAVGQEYRITAPPGDTPLWIGWQVPEASGDGLLVHWVGIAGDAVAEMALRD